MFGLAGPYVGAPRVGWLGCGGRGAEQSTPPTLRLGRALGVGGEGGARVGPFEAGGLGGARGQAAKPAVCVGGWATQPPLFSTPPRPDTPTHRSPRHGRRVGAWGVGAATVAVGGCGWRAAVGCGGRRGRSGRAGAGDDDGDDDGEVRARAQWLRRLGGGVGWWRRRQQRGWMVAGWAGWQGLGECGG